MAKLQLSKLRLALIGAGLSVGLGVLTSPTAVAANGDSFSIMRQGSDLAHCLNRQATSVSFETQTTTDGVVHESTRFTQYSNDDDGQRLSECALTSHSCQNSNLVFPVAIRTKEIDSHSAWDASDRMRLTDLIVQTLTENAEGSGHFIAANEEDVSDYRLALLGRASQAPDLVLETQIRYQGKLMSTEPLNDWFAPSHSAVLTMRLLNQRTGKLFAERNIKVSLPLTIRTRDTSGSTDRRWLSMVQNTIESQGQAMLEGFRCAPRLLTAQTVSDTHISVQLRGVRGVSVGQGLLLIPRAQIESQHSRQNRLGSSQSGWPIVRVSAVDEQHAQGDVLSGSSDACRSGECIAIPL